jgi:hypothetical protein
LPPSKNLEIFAKQQFWSLRGVPNEVREQPWQYYELNSERIPRCLRRGCFNYQYVMRLLRFTRNDNMGIVQISRLENITALHNSPKVANKINPSIIDRLVKNSTIPFYGIIMESNLFKKLNLLT